jgi:hypothetical protein
MRCKNIILYIITMIISVANACYATESSTSNSDRAESETMENQQKPLCDQHPVTKLSKEEIEKKRALWVSTKPQSYSYTVKIGGFSPNRGTFTVTCTAQDTCKVKDAQNDEPTTKSVPTIEQLFDFLQTIINDQSIKSYTVSFNPDYCFPTSITVRWGETMSLTISEFEANAD